MALWNAEISTITIKLCSNAERLPRILLSQITLVIENCHQLHIPLACMDRWSYCDLLPGDDQ